jgi:tetratricopeptide (TPR) repeat protein
MLIRSVKVRGWLLLLSFIAASCPPLFAQNSQARSTPAAGEVPLFVIVVRTPDEGQEVLERLRKGESFTRIAREKSIDPTAEAGGYLGMFSPAALRSELRDALRGVGPGQISPIAHIPSGYAILKVADDEGPKNGANAGRSQPFAATGTVKFSPDVSGLAEAEAALIQFSKPQDWDQSPRAICDMRKQSLAKVTGSVQAFLAPENEKALQGRDPFDVMQAHYAMAQLYAYQAKMDLAVEQYREAYRVALSDVPAAVPTMEEALGVIYLHKSEMENDVYRVPGKKCIFPMRPGDAYLKTDDSQKAVEYFLKYLERKPEEIEVKWLLNLAYMTVGGYPTQVPAKYLIPPATFESQEDVGRFVDVAAQAGLDSFSMAGGVIVDEFENNGRLDVVTSSFNSCGNMHFFHNNGDGTFTDQMEKAGLADQLGGLNIVQADYNNDGCTDILVLRGGWEVPQRKSLLRNNCNGTFTDVTKASGLAEPATSTQAAVWADINNDGLLDLMVVNENSPAQLFLNQGDGTFEDISIRSGINRTAFSKGVTAADYDNDGYVDFYVSNLNGENFLYHNNHDNTFTEVARKAGVAGPARGFATWFFDYDNDGYPDLFVTSYFVSLEESAKTYLGLPHNATTLKLFRNMGDGTFRDVTVETGLDRVFMPMGANFGDIDNDGFLDIYLGTGNPSYASLVPNVMLRNHDGKYFVDVTASSGTGELHKGHGIAFADLENHGDEDIVEVVGGATPSDSHALRVFQNPGHGNDWISLKLVGVKSNRGAIGARIKVTVENEGQGTRSIYRTVGSGGSFGASPLQQHIGLGKLARILQVEIWWPASNTRQTFPDVDKNQFLEIKEFAGSYSKLDRRPIQLGGPDTKSAGLASQSSGGQIVQPGGERH